MQQLQSCGPWEDVAAGRRRAELVLQRTLSQTQCQPQLPTRAPCSHGQTSSGLVPAPGWMRTSGQTAEFTHGVLMQPMHARACRCTQAEPCPTHAQAAREQGRQELERRQHAVRGRRSPACAHSRRRARDWPLRAFLQPLALLLPPASVFFPMTNSPSDVTKGRDAVGFLAESSTEVLGGVRPFWLRIFPDAASLAPQGCSDGR